MNDMFLDQVTDLEKDDISLDAWSTDFVASIRDRLENKTPLTARQGNKLMEIHAEMTE